MEKETYREGVQGWKEFAANKHDMLYQFDLAKVYSESHIVKVSHGNVAEALFRKWLERFLPKKYGVTSGYIVSQNMGFKDKKLPHYDVIIYDRLESPTLWVEDNNDKSEKGLARAIPAEYVKCVIEVKSNLTEKSSKEALNKLLELDVLLRKIDDSDSPYLGKLPSSFFTSIVFFEIKEENFYKKNILTNLIPPSNFPLFGGLILKSEGNSIELTGKFDYHLNDSEMNTDSGFEHKTLSLGRKAAWGTGPQLAEGVYVNAMLMWGEINFSEFAFDILALLNGTYRQGYSSSFYGMSWINTREKKKK